MQKSGAVTCSGMTSIIHGDDMKELTDFHIRETYLARAAEVRRNSVLQLDQQDNKPGREWSRFC